MVGRSAVTMWWRRKADRLSRFCGDFGDIRRHEGLATATTVVANRGWRFLKHRLSKGRQPLAVSRPELTTIRQTQPRTDVEAMPGILFVGYVEASLGLGESLRGLITSTAETAVPFAIYPFNVNVESRFAGPFRPERYDTENRYEINVIETAADQLSLAQRTLGDWRLRNSYTILRTYWELPVAPAEWQSLLDGIDEIWAPNAFVADAFRPIFPRPITIVPPCVEIEGDVRLERAQFGMREELFYFLFSFDYFSFPARKNPIGVLRAFQAAFPKGDERVGLVIKSTGAQEQFPEIKVIISRAAQLDPRIVVIDHTLARNEIMSLIANCDCYVSLHRSEGFGLGMVEAMTYGKPVIGTDFSGSTDFLGPETGYPIACRLRPVERGEYIYSDGQVWAEPDLEAASAAMRSVLSEPERAAIKAAAGQAFVRHRYSRASVGETVAARAEAILAARRAARADRHALQSSTSF